MWDLCELDFSSTLQQKTRIINPHIEFTHPLFYTSTVYLQRFYHVTILLQ